MKRHEIIFSILKVPLDFAVVISAFFIARGLRLQTSELFWIVLEIQTIDTERLFQFAIVWALIYVWTFAAHGLYKIQIFQSKIEEITSIFRYGIYWFFFFSVWVYLWNWIIYTGWEIPRLIIVYTSCIALTGSIFIRIILNLFQSYLISKWILEKRKLVIVSDVPYKELSAIISDISKAWIYNIVWYVAEQKKEKYKITYLGKWEFIDDILSNTNCDELLYIRSKYNDTTLYKIWESARIAWVRYRYITNNFDITKTNTTLSLIHKIPVIEILNTPLQSWNRVFKRIFDIIFSATALVLLSPIILITWILIKIEDPSWPAIYKNMRVWQSWKQFACLKFRYMYWKYCIKEWYWIEMQRDPAYKMEEKLIQSQNSREWPLYKIQDDPRKTQIWKILEKYSLDEIPQFFNVLFWDMSIVGPRPHQPREVEKYEKYHKRLLTVKPGMTWMAQVHWREKNSFNREAELDLFYIENWDFMLDIKIILKTITFIFFLRR